MARSGGDGLTFAARGFFHAPMTQDSSVQRPFRRWSTVQLQP
jgi:hypothetical protein